MSPTLARAVLHTAHLFTFALLLLSGLLLLIPGLRSVITGGYSLVIRETHRWGGVAFVALPALIVLGTGTRTVFAARTQHTAKAVWQRLHVAVTVLMSIVFTATGFALWTKALLPEPFLDTSLLLHDWLTYGAIALLGAHLFDVGLSALVARFQAAAVAPRSEA